MRSALAKRLGPKQHYLMPGRLVLTTKPGHIETVLGSCVAVVLFCPGRPLLGMNHIMLPGDAPRNNPQPLAYAQPALRALLHRFLAYKPSEVQVKVFGGASTWLKHEYAAVGPRILQDVETWVAHHNLQVAATDVGGQHGRTIYARVQDAVVYRRLHTPKQ